MPIECKRNVSVILFDLKMDRGKSMRILNEIILHMNLVRSNDITSLILLHSANTKNDRKLKHVEVAIEEVPYNSDLKRLINDKETSDANWLDGLTVAANILKENVSRYIFTLQLIFITDLGVSAPKGTEKQVIEIKKQLDINEIHLYIIGPEVEFDKTISTKDDVHKAMQTCRFNEKNANAKIALDIVQSVRGVICGEELSLDFLTFYSNTITSQPWKIPLTFEGFEFPTCTQKILSKVALPKVVAENKATVKFMIPPEDETKVGEEIEKEETVHVHKFMNKVLVIPDEIRKLRYEGERMFKIVGFVEAKDIPEIVFTGEDVYLVTGIADDPRAKAFDHLVNALHKKNKYALALRVYNRNNVPKIYMLIPAPPGQFVMILHPERVGPMCRLNEPKAQPSEVGDEQLENYSTYLKELAGQKWELNPVASTGVYYKQVVRNTVEVITGEKYPKIDREVKKSDALCKIESDLKIEKVVPATSGVAAGDDKKMNDDDDEDW